MTDPKIHICRGVNRRFSAYARLHGYKLWTKVGRERRSMKSAAEDMLRAFLKSRSYKRAAVMMVADYYDPVIVCEITR